MTSRLSYVAAAAVAIGVVISTAPATAHDTNPNTRKCHSTCEGAFPSRLKHKHPGTDCSKTEVCHTGLHEDPDLAGVKRQTCPPVVDTEVAAVEKESAKATARSKVGHPG